MWTTLVFAALWWFFKSHPQPPVQTGTTGQWSWTEKWRLAPEFYICVGFICPFCDALCSLSILILVHTEQAVKPRSSAPWRWLLNCVYIRMSWEASQKHSFSWDAAPESVPAQRRAAPHWPVHRGVGTQRRPLLLWDAGQRPSVTAKQMGAG